MADDFARQLLDALYNPETQPPQQPSRPLREKLAGAAETAATIGTGLLGSVPAGLAGLSQMIPTRGHRPSVNRAAQKVEDVQSALTYLPRTEAGQEYLEKTAGALGMLGAPAEFLGEQTLKLTGSPFLATTANVGLDPVNYIGIPGTGKALVSGTKAAGRTIAAAPRVAGEMASDLLMGQGRMEGQRGAIKMKGGNWLAGEVEGATEPLRQKGAVGSSPEEMLAQMRERYTPEVIAALEPPLQESVARSFKTLEGMFALNNWIDKKLNRYIKNEMATPEDPVRKLAEQGTLHYEPQVDAFVRSYAKDQRAGSSMPFGQLGTSPLARAWEDVADMSVIPTKAEDWQKGGKGRYLQENPWIEKVAPEADVYSMASVEVDRLGFDHLIDELKNSIRPDSDLPAHLRWKPEDLEKVTMEQAVRRVHDINEYRAAKKAEANEVLARNPATVTFKEYPTIPGTDLPNERGLAWKEIKPPEMSVELPQGWSEPVQKGNALQSKSVDGGIALGADLPDLIKNIYKRHPETPGNPRKALEEALKYEGDVMGHCVGGYCDDVLSGRTKIYSLRDNKGEPLVTIEVGKPDYLPRWESVVQYLDQAKEQVIKDRTARGLDVSNEKQIEDLTQLLASQMAKENAPLEIKQIKGSGKKDRSQRLRIKETGYKDEPDAYLLPFIQDFVRSGNWSLVNDIQNTGLITPDRVLSSETRKRLEAQGVQIPKYMTEQEAKELSKQAIRASDIPTLDQSAGGMKRGGSVHISDNPDTMQLELQVGGAVKAAKAAAKQAAKAAEKEGLSVPFDIPRAPAKSKEEIRPIAERMARQMTGEFVRLDPKESINPAGKSLKRFLQEKEFEKDYITRPTTQVTEPEFADIEKQLGMVKFGIPGDTTIANQELIQAGPYKLDIPSPQHGGPRFPLGGEGAWASNNPQAANVQKRAVEMSEYFNAPVMGQYIAMGPTGSNFAQHFADASLRAIDLSKMSKSQIEQFNELIRKGSEDSGPRPSFPGIQDKDQAYFWLSWDPELRKHFNALMVKPKYTQPFGLPDGRVILDAITEPALRNKEISTSGFSQFDLDPSIKPEDIPLSMHPTYTHLIPMKKDAPVRQTRYPIPAELEFPDVTKFIRERYRPSEFTPTFQKASPRQKIDQQAIDEIKMYEEMMKSLTGKKEGGAVEMASGGGVGEKRDLASKIAGGGIRGVITRGLLGMDPPEDMTPREREIYENAARASAPAQGLGVGKAIFIGATAKTWNKAAAARAVELERAGVSPEQIWRETGTFRGADGKLRQEISDVGAVHRNPKELQELGKAKKEEARELQLRLVGTPGQKDLFPKALTEAKRPVREQVKQLKEEAFKLMLPSDTRGQSARFALEHPELYKAYPELADIPVYQGVYGSGRELGSLRGAAGDLEMSVTQAGLRQSPKSTMLHEMQHAVQSLEGMSPGGSSAMAFQDPKAFEILSQIRQKASEPITYDKYLETLIEANPGKKLSDINPDVARQGYESYLRSIPESVKKFDRDFQVQAANEYYKRLAGEAEARATQYREGMGPTQRRQEFPYSSYDVLPDDLIVKPPRSGLPGAAESASEIPADIAARMAAQRAELVLRSRAIQELKDQFENLPQPPKGFLSSESILQRMDEIRRREATPSGEQIPLLKKGGAIEMQVGGALKAAAKAAERAAKAAKPEVLTAAERDANLAKMLQESKAKTRLYHGTKAHDEYADEPGQAFKQFTSSPTWLAKEPYTASGYSGGTGSIYPVYAQIKKPLVLGFDANDEASKAFAAAKRLGVDVEYIKGMSAPEKAWEVINHPSFIDAVERAGYDGISVKEGGYRTFGVLDPRRIKSATGNRGTFDVTNPDITKKRGGKVSITDNLDTMRLAVQKRK